MNTDDPGADFPGRHGLSADATGHGSGGHGKGGHGSGGGDAGGAGEGGPVHSAGHSPGYGGSHIPGPSPGPFPGPSAGPSPGPGHDPGTATPDPCHGAAAGFRGGPPSVSVVLPVYNEEGNLRPLAAELLPALQALGRGFEVIFVDDGSTDRSLDVIRDLGREHPGVRHIALDGNHGQSAAFLAGFAAARAPVTVTMDADGQNDPADVAGLLDVLDRAAHQGPTAVVGWRARRRDSVAKRLGSRVGNLVRNLVTGHAVRDTGCSLKAMPTHLLQRLPAFDGMHRFLPTLLAARGAAIIEVRVNHRPRSWGVSKYSNLRRALVGLADVFGVRWLNSRAVTCRVRGRDEAS